MGELIKELERFGDHTSTFTLLDVSVVFALSFVLSLIIGWSYRTTHKGVSYSQTYVHTLILFSLVVSFVMLIIGSNIARAFTLVGALSIVRFRHAVKEPRDIGFVFTAMAVGMACGTRFYALAIFATLVIVAVALVLFKLNLFAKVLRERILIVRVAGGADIKQVFSQVFREYLEEFRLISMETVGEADYQEAVYSVVIKPEKAPNTFLDAVRDANGGRKASLVLGQQEIDL
jgi:uncharacterized membrane protein YhiD involved in acid resistance